MKFSLKSIVCYVSSVEKATIFYRKIGFPIEEESGDYARVSLSEGVDLELHDGDKEVIPDLIEEATSPIKGRGIFLYLRVDAVEMLRSELKANNVNVSEIHERPWGNTEFTATDPDGYKLVFYQRE